MDKNKQYLQHIGNNLRKIRTKAGFSQQELADNSNVAKSTIQRIEKGDLNPSVTLMKNISDALNIDLSSMI
ncbi:MAG: helix-turn-helix domain-containing protein [Bacteroidota bacterium]